MPDEPLARAETPVGPLQEKQALERALLDSAVLFAGDVTRFSREWQVRWSDPAMTLELAEISAALQLALDGLVNEFRRPDGPSQPLVAGFLGMLLGTPDAPGPLARLQALTDGDTAAMSLDDQRLLSETDALSIQLSGFRAQWQDYLTLVTDLERGRIPRAPETMPPMPPLPPNPAWLRAFAAPPAGEEPPAGPGRQVGRPPGPLAGDEAPGPSASPAWQDADLRHGLGGTLKVLLALVAALLAVVFLAYQVAIRLPERAANQPALTPAVASSTPLAPAATPTPQPTNTPTPTITPQPSATPTPSGAGGTQLSVNPPVLVLPCPGSGAAPLQLVDTGSQPLDWQAAAAGANGAGPGILLDGAASEQGHLNPGEVAQLSVTAQTTDAQGTITITATGAANPITVAYSVSC
jgi:hypothetical protein